MKSLFPHVGCGMQYPVTLERVIVWSGGLEAQIEAVVGDVPITFFDCRYGEHGNWYQEGTTLDFVLSAVACECGPVDEEFIDVTIRPELRESMSGEGEPPKKMSLKGTSMLIPVEEWDYDAYRFRAPVQEGVREAQVPASRGRFLRNAEVVFDTGGAAHTTGRRQPEAVAVSPCPGTCP